MIPFYQNTEMKWYRICSCGKEIIYSNRKSAYISCMYKTKNTCRSCSNSGDKNGCHNNPCLWNKRPKSKETIKKMSEAKIGRSLSNETKRKMSLTRMGNKYTLGYKWPIEKKKIRSNFKKEFYKNNPLEVEKMARKVKEAMHKPDVRKRHIDALVRTNFLGRTVDVGQRELLEKWNKLGFNFEINYQVHTDDFICYIDGYDKEKNVVLEYDSKYHNKLGQKKKDLIRQNKVIDILKPNKFWRYDAVNKQFRNVIKDG